LSGLIFYLSVIITNNWFVFEGGSFKKIKPGDCVVAFSQRDLYQVRREIEKDSKQKCAIIYGGLPPGEETLVCIHLRFRGATSRFVHLKILAQIFKGRRL